MKGRKRVELGINDEDHVAAVTTIAAIGAAKGHVLFTAEGDAAIAPSPALTWIFDWSRTCFTLDIVFVINVKREA